MPKIDTAVLHAVSVLHEDEQVRQGERVHSVTLYSTDTEAVPLGCYCVVTVQVRRLDGGRVVTGAQTTDAGQWWQVVNVVGGGGW